MTFQIKLKQLEQGLCILHGNRELQYPVNRHQEGSLGPVLDIAVPANLKPQREMKLLHYKKCRAQRAHDVLKQAVDHEHQRPKRFHRIFKLQAFFKAAWTRSEEHTSELQSRQYLVCRLLLEKK